MQIEPTAEWLQGVSLELFRYLDEGASYDPDSPYPTSGGRFDDGKRPTLYLASSREGAVAEFLRRHPEFLGMQDFLRIRVFAVRVHVTKRCLDLRWDDLSRRAGIELVRLMSNDRDGAIRYAYSRTVADLVDAEAGIAFPSAAYAPPTWCLVLFGHEGERWRSEGFSPVTRPAVDPAAVSVLPA